MLLNLSKFSVVGTIISTFAIGSSALVACSGVDDYPPAEQGGAAQQQGNGGSATASGGSGNGGTPTGNGGSGTGGANNNGGSGNAKGGASNGNGGSNNGNGGSNNARGGSNNGNGGGSSRGGTGSGTGGNASGTGGGASTGASFSQVQTIVKNQCGSCHAAGAQSPNLGSTGSTLYNTLTSTTVRECSSTKLVTAGNASMSALVNLVSNKCSLKMPPSCSGSGTCIPQSDIDTISSWINAGAKQQ